MNLPTESKWMYPKSYCWARKKKSQTHLTTFEQLIIQPFMAEVIEFGIEVLVFEFPFGKL